MSDLAKSHDKNFMSSTNVVFLKELVNYFEGSDFPTIDKLENFPKYTTRSSIARFIAKYEIFKKIIDIQGSIIECGVLHGGGLLTWLQLSSILEPANHQRRIIGFDTFDGFPSVSGADKSKDTSVLCENGQLAVDSYDDIIKCVEIHNMTRYFNHIPKVEIIRGDVRDTFPPYIVNNPHLIVALLYLDFDIYLPTQLALKTIVPLMPVGSIIAFDELAQPLWPGETVALKDTIGINKSKIQRFSFGTSISYIVKE